MKDQVFGVLQRIGRSFMLPIALLPVAGLLLGIGGSFSNTTMLETYGLTRIMGPGTFWNALFTVMSQAGDIVFANLPILFAMGIAIGMAKKEKEVAALAAVISFLVMHAAIGAMIAVNGGTDALKEGAGAMVAGIQSLQMGVFGGILVGLGTAWLHNRYYRIELPQVLSFFGGTRFVPIVSALFYVLVGILMYFIWPPVQAAISGVGGFVLRSGYPGTWFYGFMERALIPFGLHHVFYIPFWQTAVGGTMEIGGKIVEGAQNIFFAELADPGNTRFSVEATRFMAGKFPLMIFGLPGAALAMYQAALPEKKKEVSGLLLSAALTSMLTGITEPLEFTFLFTAPLLYGIHCVFAGLAYMLMHMLDVGVGMTFSGGLIDLFLFGILQGNKKTGWLWIVVVGVFYFLMYCAVFLVLIRKLDYKTPGREVGAAAKLYTRSDVEQRKEERKETGPGQTGREKSAGKTGTRSGEILKGLGGPDNITDVDCCATRLRCTVKDEKKVDESVLKATGASGVIKKGKGVQIIYGPQVSVIKSDLEEYMEKYGDESDEGDSHELIKSPMTGTVILLSEVPDEAFAGKMMGDGAAVIPDDEYVYAPADGTVTFVFPTKHAVGFRTDGGHEMLLHVGIDTVSLSGDGFEAFVHDGDHVRTGDKLLKADIQKIKDKVPSLASPVLFTDLPDGLEVHILKYGKIRNGEPFLELYNKEKQEVG
ncbi:PTS glucose transporter subunit IIA [Clostridiaceae bacterium TF01-6]|nr:PTS glucose transporter subunit IIA [Clostridiaceae bacterium TF01-6]